MALEIEKFSVLLLDTTLTDQQLKEELLFIKDYSVHSVFVLPYQVARAKQLLADTNIRIGSYADYPLGMGTVGKKAFETGQLYEDGASIVQTVFEPKHMFIERHVKEVYEALEPISYGRGELGLVFDINQLPDEEKLKLCMRVSGFGVRHLSLGMNLSIEDAVYDLGIFRLSGKVKSVIQINVKAPTLLDLEMLFQAGASMIGINNPREVLPLIEKWE